MVVTPGQFLKCRHENSTKETNMTTQFTIKRASQTLFIVLISCLLRCDTNTGACTKAGSNEGKIAVSGVEPSYARRNE